MDIIRWWSGAKPPVGLNVNLCFPAGTRDRRLNSSGSAPLHHKIRKDIHRKL